MCSLDGTETIIVGTILISLYVLPSIVAVAVFSCHTIRYIKKNSNLNERSVRRLIKIIATWVILSLIFRSPAMCAPFLPQLDAYSPGISHVVSFPAYYVAELNYPMFLLLVLFLHTKVRESMKNNIQKYFLRKPKGVQESSEVTTENLSSDTNL